MDRAPPDSSARVPLAVDLRIHDARRPLAATHRAQAPRGPHSPPPDRLAPQARHVRTYDDTGHANQRAAAVRALLAEYVHRRPGEMSAPDRIGERSLVDQTAARSVDEI